MDTSEKKFFLPTIWGEVYDGEKWVKAQYPILSYEIKGDVVTIHTGELAPAENQ